MARKTKCPFCGVFFDRDVVPFVHNEKTGRYAHKECADKDAALKAADEKNRDALMKYIDTLYKGKSNYPLIGRLLKRYKEELNFTYSGILNTLRYCYEVKGNSIEKANNSIGIVEYQYQNAYNYYYSIWLANQNNKDKVIENYIPVQREIHIPVPQRNLRKRKLFSFLDEENTDGK